MKLVLYGASGMIGSRILQELASRGHQVTAVVRHPEKVTVPAATVLQGDVLDAKSVAETARGADAAIGAYAPPPNDAGKLVEATRTILQGLADAGVQRFIMVGGAGSLQVAPGRQLLDAPDFPEMWKPYAIAHRDALAVLQAADIDWTNFSPAALIEPGQRTGMFRLGMDTLVTNEKGESRISAEDYAAALVDELEQPQYIRQRFTAGY